MTPPARPPVNLVNVRGTALLAGDSREQYRQKLARITLDSMAQFVGLLDAQGTVLEINQVALDAAGVALADVEGRPFWTTFWWQVSEPIRATLRASIARAARGEFVRWDTEIYGRAGGKETIVIDASLCPVKDERGEVVFITAEGRDITEKKAHEREIAQKNVELQGLLERIRELDESQAVARSLGREQRAREEAELQKRLLYSVFMQAPLFIAVLRGPDHVVELANPPMCQQIWQRPEAELLNRPLFEAMPGLGDQGARALLGRVYRTGEPYVGRETPVTFERGGGAVETLYFNFIYSALRNVDGAIEGIFVVASDVTAQALARQQVEGLREAAEGANRAKDEFLAMLGHELRNPLSPILTALQLMRQQGPEVAERARVVIERQVNHLTRLVDDLLDVSRIARGRVELKKEVVELADVVAKGVEISSPLLEQRAHELTVDVPARGLPVDGDPTRLGQVVSNLLTNAAKYTPPGGRVAVRARRDGDEAVLSVRDSGVGIAPDVLPRVFDLFVQSRRSIDRSEGGLGLGLTIVRSLVEGHGGAVSAHSEGPGKGSEFVVRLPLSAGPHRPEGRPDEAAPAVAGPRAGGPRILVVDDNEDGATMLALALTRRGYDARVANDAATALEIAAEFRPDVAFLDIGLPVMDGYELGSHLRTIAGLEGLRLVALTGYGQESDRRRSREAGFQHHLVKPVAIDALEEVIREH
jgi:PAS domain S-box-containing protein